MGSAFDYFNLKGMELCDAALELEFSPQYYEEALEEILKEFG